MLRVHIGENTPIHVVARKAQNGVQHHHQRDITRYDDQGVSPKCLQSVLHDAVIPLLSFCVLTQSHGPGSSVSLPDWPLTPPVYRGRGSFLQTAGTPGR